MSERRVRTGSERTLDQAFGPAPVEKAVRPSHAEAAIAALTAALRELGAETATATVTVTHTVTAGWQERVHLCPAETVLDIDEAAEALGLSREALRKRLDRRQLLMPWTMRFGKRTFLAADVRRALAPPLPPGVTLLARRRARG